MRRHARASTAGSTERKPSDLGGSSPARGPLAAVLAFAAALAVMAFSAASASAAELPFLETFGSAAQPTFSTPAGIAVDQSSGDVLVIDTTAGKVLRYKPDGTPDEFAALGSNAIEGLSFGEPREVQVAVDSSGGPADGDIYVTQSSSGAVDVFDSEGNLLEALSESKEGGLGEPCGVSVGPEGSVYVSSYGEPGSVHKYEPSGAFPVKANNTLNFSAEEPCTLAAGAGPTAGSVFVDSYEVGGVTKFDGTTGAEEYVVSPGIAVSSGVNPANGHLFLVGFLGEPLKEFNASGAKAVEVSSTSVGSENAANGVGVNGAGHRLYASDAAAGANNVKVYSTASGPTNRRTLTVTKEAGGSGGIGTVSSKPKGINCATACDEAVASMYENQTVVLKGKAATGSTLSGWTGCESTTVISSIEGTCTVEMKEAKAVTATFAGTSKAIVNPKALTLTKAGSGFGTVKAAGLSCESECSETTVLYQGPVFSPKFKAGKTVELKETAAYGSSFTGWSGACSGSEPTCKVTMEEAAEVTAEFTAKPKTTLTIEKNSYETGTGTVSSKPKGINCATACTTQAMSVPSGETIVLKGKAATGMTLTGWTGCASTTVISATEGTCTVSPTSATTVKATFSGSPKAIVNPKALTLTKAGSGYGTVKAAGLACEAECTTATVLFGGPVFTPKFKPGKTVLLKATSAPGSGTVSWSGCLEEPTPAECVVVMEEDSSVTAGFDELE